jgi:predicted ester cyclase
MTTGHHRGPWRWGGPTGRKVNLWGIANCVVRENQIVEEWVLYNTTSRLMQLGIDVAWAAREYAKELAQVGADRHVGEVSRLVGGRAPEYYRPDGDRAEIENFVRAVWHNVYNRRDLSWFDKAYAASARWRGPSNRIGHGRQDVRAMARALLATFPDLGMRVDEVYWMGNDRDGYRVSVRWSAEGTHRGYALYGEPTQRRVSLWGIDQLYVTDGQITEDWMMFNEFDVLAQVLGDDPAPMLG